MERRNLVFSDRPSLKKFLVKNFPEIPGELVSAAVKARQQRKTETQDSSYRA